MPNEAGHIQITEFSREVIPTLNFMMEDLFCQYGLNMPYFLLDFDFPDYSQRPDWCSGYNFNLGWGEWGYYLPWFNSMINIICDEAGVPKWQLPDFNSWDMFNAWISQLYENVSQSFTASSRRYRKIGEGATCTLAWDDYDNNPAYTLFAAGATGYTMFGCSGGTGSGGNDQGIGIKSYLNFDTVSGAIGRSSLILRLEVTYVFTVQGNPVIYVYDHDFGDTIDSSDWTGGTKIAEQEVSAIGTCDITLPVATINTGIGASTKIRVSEKICELNTPPAGTGGPIVNFSSAKLIWT